MTEQGRKIKKILSSKITLFFLLLGFIWLIMGVVNVYYKKYQINKQVEKLKSEIAKTEQNNQQISAMIDYLGSQSFLEKEAREKLNMKKEGEEVVMVEPAKNLAGAGAQAPGELLPENESQAKPQVSGGSNKEKESNFSKWRRYFFK
jgi:cell division protein FtsL